MTRTLVAAVLGVGLAGTGQLAAEQEVTGRQAVHDLVGELKSDVRVPGPDERRIPPPVPEDIRGTVTATKSGYLVLTIGKDAGLAPGQSLDLYRAAPTPRYLGTVVIMRTYPKEAVGVFKPANPKKALKDLKPDELPQVGDTVGRIGSGN